MDNRQLLTFHLVPNVPLVHEYDKILMMESVMSGDRENLEEYFQDIERQRFSLIVSGNPATQPFNLETRPWAFESNLWRVWIDKQLLCYYELDQDIPTKIPLKLLVPRKAPCQ